MDIVFGLWADGGAYPDHGADGHGALGAPVVGPSGLIDILETRYGMSVPPAAYVVRIAAWQGALASEIAGQWLGTVAEDRSLVLIAQTGDTQLLDHGLAGSGQPRAGRSSRSPYRGSLQVLLLAFKITWRPFDAHALMELLLFQRSPVAARAAWRLAAALEEAPGRGGEPWLAAWKAIEAQELDAATDEKLRAKAAARLARWRSWVEPIETDPDAGMPATEVVAICDRVISWAITRHAGEADPLYLTTARLAGDVRNALIALERTHYPRTLVERIIDQALDEGHDNPAAFAEAAHWRSIVHPGAVWAPVDLVLWWDFADAGELLLAFLGLGRSAPSLRTLGACSTNPSAEPAHSARLGTALS